MRAAAARAASRRGSSTRIFLSFAQGSSSSTSGTRVVLPAPGGATSTAALFARQRGGQSAAARRRWEATVSNLRMFVIAPREDEWSGKREIRRYVGVYCMAPLARGLTTLCCNIICVARPMLS